MSKIIKFFDLLMRPRLESIILLCVLLWFFIDDFAIDGLSYILAFFVFLMYFMLFIINIKTNIKFNFFRKIKLLVMNSILIAMMFMFSLYSYFEINKNADYICDFVVSCVESNICDNRENKLVSLKFTKKSEIFKFNFISFRTTYGFAAKKDEKNNMFRIWKFDADSGVYGKSGEATCFLQS